MAKFVVVEFDQPSEINVFFYDSNEEFKSKLIQLTEDVSDHNHDIKIEDMSIIEGAFYIDKNCNYDDVNFRRLLYILDENNRGWRFDHRDIIDIELIRKMNKLILC